MANNDMSAQAAIDEAEALLIRAAMVAEMKRTMVQAPTLRVAIEECARTTAQALECGLLSRKSVERLREALREHDQTEDTCGSNPS